jgi:hypothetical protein
MNTEHKTRLKMDKNLEISAKVSKSLIFGLWKTVYKKYSTANCQTVKRDRIFFLVFNCLAIVSSAKNLKSLFSPLIKL